MSVVEASTSGDIAWVLASTALVMLMTPALGFFYGGLVRKKNLVSTIVQCVVIFAVISIIWALWGYSLVFGNSTGGIIGDFSLVALHNLDIDFVNPALAGSIPELLFFAFQLKFAAITPALIIGACAERIRFKSLLIFIVLWSTLIYVPIAHWVWNPDGWFVLQVLLTCRRYIVHFSRCIWVLLQPSYWLTKWLWSILKTHMYILIKSSCN